MFFLFQGEAGVFIGSILLISACSFKVGESGRFCCWICSLLGDMS